MQAGSGFQPSKKAACKPSITHLRAPCNFLKDTLYTLTEKSHEDADLSVGVTQRKPKIKYTQTPSPQTRSRSGLERH